MLLVLGRIVLGFIFLYAAYTKLHFGGGWHLGDYQFFFAMAIDSYKMLPMWAVEWMARVLPWFELTLGALLVIGDGLRWTGSISQRAAAGIHRSDYARQDSRPGNQLWLLRQ